MTEDVENLVLKMLRENRDDMNMIKSRLEQIEHRMNISEKRMDKIETKLSGLANIVVYIMGQIEEMKQK